MTVGWGNGGRDEIPAEMPCSPLWLRESEAVPWSPQKPGEGKAGNLVPATGGT